ncbi:MAG: hypothetical protein COA94_07820 [Rickettsiales bacterium]|nr:MAG: hypothetical protein COA94_07820 [Rickettsiales bacterium]
MFEFIEFASAIRALYQYVNDELVEEDFWLITEEQRKRLPKEDQTGVWYMLNPDKQKKDQNSVFLVDKAEKDRLIRAVAFIKSSAKKLPESASFLEKLLYCKKTLPPVLFKLES